MRAWLVSLAAFSAVGCTVTVDRAALLDPIPFDGSVMETSVADTGATPPTDTGAPPPMDTGVAPPTDTGTPPPVDTGGAPPVDTGTPPVDTGVVAVDTGVDVPACRACPPTETVQFCAGSGSGLCLAYAGCSDRCLACLPSDTSGDNCAMVATIAARGRSTTVLTTCGQRDDLGVGCGVEGVDIVFRVRVHVRGRLVVGANAPAGARLNMGYAGRSDRCPGNEGSRTCITGAEPNARGAEVRDAPPGDYYFFITTMPAATVVVDVVAP